jgi:translation elongation factor EF-Tu-like GTPase
VAATFRVESTFAIKGRGLVISGQVASGAVEVGGTVTIPDSKGTGRARRITGVETANGLDSRGQIRAQMGLVLGKLPLVDLGSARAHLVPGLILTVSDPEAEVLSLFPPPTSGPNRDS